MKIIMCAKNTYDISTQTIWFRGSANNY